METPDKITIRRPDDWHVHLRDGAVLEAVAGHTARAFARAIVMPNLAPPVTTIDDALRYRDHIRAAVGDNATFTPLMTCYLTDEADADEIRRGFDEGVFSAVKLYPAGATTNSAMGVTDMSRVSGVLEMMQDIGMPLLVHGEVTDPEIDIFDREAVYIERVLSPMLSDFAALKVVFEHITTSQAVAFVRAQGPRLGATITAHHLLIDRNDMFKGGIRPHLYCLPIAKRKGHRLALLEAATSGEESFFLGTDSAPHAINLKEAACGCAGVFSAPAALELYAHVFDQAGALDKLEAFASLNGPAFYGLPANEDTVSLVREDWQIPVAVHTAGDADILSFMAGETLSWKLAD
ncbi:MAG: dihydroorotase [Rhodospirillaceae bacterium]|nr:dihydroorotase [Rhodospirillaceae bacterium]MBL6931212.1 dihydroorotase [Rhodospirillales bacterium]MBL6941412.1 dihydroorotase [Rhodospirillales bacterium]